jgi:hypothetical protein
MNEEDSGSSPVTLAKLREGNDSPNVINFDLAKSTEQKRQV